MNYPSIKTIMERLADPLSKQDSFSPKRAAVLIRAYMLSADNPKRVDAALDEISGIIGGYGVQPITDNEWDGYYCDAGALYVNMGDTYVPTVVYDTRKDRWMICSWGDLVEGDPKRFCN
jgi:hypothetical protein